MGLRGLGSCRCIIVALQNGPGEVEQSALGDNIPRASLLEGTGLSSRSCCTHAFRALELVSCIL